MTEPWHRADETAAHFGFSRQTLIRLYDEEGLPARLASGGAGRRRLLIFRWSEIDVWLAGRRERQVRGTLEGSRFTRDGAA